MLIFYKTFLTYHLAGCTRRGKIVRRANESDLEVHREQTAGSAKYFGTDDPSALADHLMSAAQDTEPLFVRNLVPDLDERVSMFAADFARTIRNASLSWQSRMR